MGFTEEFDFKDLVHMELYDVIVTRQEIADVFKRHIELEQLEAMHTNLSNYDTEAAALARRQLIYVAALLALSKLEPERFETDEEQNKLNAAVDLAIKSIYRAVKLIEDEVA